MNLSSAVSYVGWALLVLLVLATIGGQVARTWWAMILLGSAVPVLRALTAVAVLTAFSVGDYLVALVGLACIAGVTLLRGRHRARSARDAATGPTVRLVTLNLWDQSDDLDSLADEIIHADADLVLLQELTPLHLRRLEASSTFTGFTWSVVTPRYGAHGMGLWSKRDIAGASVWDLEGVPQIRASVRLPDSPPVAFYGIHIVSPVRRSFASWRASLSRLQDEAVRAPRPLIMAGDFNATSDHGPFRSLLGAGFHDATTRWWWEGPKTWPNGRRFVPSLLRLDHVLVSSEFRVSKCRVGRGRGSDHKPLVVEIALVGETSPTFRAPEQSGDRPEDCGDLTHAVGTASDLDPRVGGGSAAHDPEPEHGPAAT